MIFKKKKDDTNEEYSKKLLEKENIDKYLHSLDGHYVYFNGKICRFIDASYINKYREIMYPFTSYSHTYNEADKRWDDNKFQSINERIYDKSLDEIKQIIYDAGTEGEKEFNQECIILDEKELEEFNNITSNEIYYNGYFVNKIVRKIKSRNELLLTVKTLNILTLEVEIKTQAWFEFYFNYMTTQPNFETDVPIDENF